MGRAGAGIYPSHRSKMLDRRGASAHPALPFADYPRAVLGGGGTAETDFAQRSIGPPKGDIRPASAQRLQRDRAGGVSGSISLGSAPRASR